MSTPEKMKQLQKRRDQLLRELFAVHLMIPGSFNEVYRRCGKPNCWCHDQVGHPLKRITWSEKGGVRSKAIPEQDVEWVEKATSNYREFRSKRREILELEKDLKAILDEYEEEVVRKSRMMRDYL
jgi:hypothetical protein